MGIERRKNQRKPVSFPAGIYLADGSLICQCELRDVSDMGARLRLLVSKDEPAKEVPAEFILSLSRDGKVFRRCALKWNRNDEVGVLFTSRQKSKAR